MRLVAEGVSVGYGGRAVVGPVDLRAESGEVVGLIGPNGAGKSTLLRGLTGVLPLISGRVLCDGQPLDSLSARERARRIAFVPQSEPTLFDFTVRDVVLMGRHPHVSARRGETAADHDAAARAMAATDTLHLAERSVTALSGGEHRRALIARALAQDAPIVVLDEPAAHLDIAHQSTVLTGLRRLAETRGVAVIAAVHELNLAAEFCHRLVLLSGGRVVAEGSPERVLTPEVIGAAYGARVCVTQSPATGRPLVVPLPASRDPSSGREAVHVVCGGGAGRAVLAALHERGYRVTAGVLNRLDSDEDAARALGIDHVTERPYSPISPEARAACAELMKDANAIVIAEVPFGSGNLANLDLALEAQAAGARVYLMGQAGTPSLDYTGGVATERADEALRRGAVRVASVAELLDSLDRASPAPEPGRPMGIPET